MIWVSRNGAKIDCLGTPLHTVALLKFDMIAQFGEHWMDLRDIGYVVAGRSSTRLSA